MNGSKVWSLDYKNLIAFIWRRENIKTAMLRFGDISIGEDMFCGVTKNEVVISFFLSLYY